MGEFARVLAGVVCVEREREKDTGTLVGVVTMVCYHVCYHNVFTLLLGQENEKKKKIPCCNIPCGRTTHHVTVCRKYTLLSMCVCKTYMILCSCWLSMSTTIISIVVY